MLISHRITIGRHSCSHRLAFECLQMMVINKDSKANLKAYSNSSANKHSMAYKPSFNHRKAFIEPSVSIRMLVWVSIRMLMWISIRMLVWVSLRILVWVSIRMLVSVNIRWFYYTSRVKPLNAKP